ncbi:MAG: CNNM domain-containing protein [Micrococcales bacterium]|nr:CNNM domain-containing protein [Micrococcales bacterium]
MIWVALLALAANAFFVGAEFALMSVRRSQMAPLAEAGSRPARMVIYALGHMPSMLACLQLGVTVASTGLGAVAEATIATALVSWFGSWGLGVAAAHAVAAVMALVLVVFLHVVLGEMVPKNLALAAPTGAALLLGPVLVVLAWVLTPITASLRWVADGTLRLFKVTPKAEVRSTYTAGEVAAIVEHSAAKGTLEDSQGLLRETLEFSTQQARELMVADADLVAVSLASTPVEVEALVAQTGFSRFPVRRAEGLDLVGYVHIMDVAAVRTGRDQPIEARLVRSMVHLEGSDELEEVLESMQLAGCHMVQIDGGVVFMEDVLEELVGEIRDAQQRRPGWR